MYSMEKKRISLASWNFEGPFPLEDWEPPRRAAVYAIMWFNPKIARPSGAWQVVYVGESGNLSERGFYLSHHAYPCWKKEAETPLHISYLALPDSTEEERRKIERAVIRLFRPPCNTQYKR